MKRLLSALALLILADPALAQSCEPYCESITQAVTMTVNTSTESGKIVANVTLTLNQNALSTVTKGEILLDNVVQARCSAYPCATKVAFDWHTDHVIVGETTMRGGMVLVSQNEYPSSFWTGQPQK